MTVTLQMGLPFADGVSGGAEEHSCLPDVRILRLIGTIHGRRGRHARCIIPTRSASEDNSFCRPRLRFGLVGSMNNSAQKRDYELHGGGRNGIMS
jgi:hypothetical protein